ITEDELAVSEPEMIWLSQRAHGSISTLMAEKVLPDAATRLKEVERQTLHWTAEGKTAAEVAAILEMTERNVNFHIRNA
ncbi:LuxR C-terminal-related transcriptional regulator, partial [Escherichia coli]|uniref:LuxR C-terminal-related transcriptional regulator n=2 Tax=Pseudomonadota TaxID=1224 RepID=UPI0020218E54